MALVVETGEGLAGAMSYVSVEDADKFSAYRLTWTAATQEQKEAALVAATQYIDIRFLRRFPGERAKSTQGLEWPRTGTQWAKNVVPPVVIRACTLYAVHALSGPLFIVPKLSESGTAGMVTEKTVGPITKKFSAMASGYGSRVEAFGQFPDADMLMFTAFPLGCWGAVR